MSDREEAGDAATNPTGTGQGESGHSDATRDPGNARTGPNAPGETLRRPGPKRFVRGIVLSMAAVGLFLGVGVYLLAEVGGFSILPSGLDQALQLAEATNRTEDARQAIIKSQKGFLAYFLNEIAPFLAFTLSPLFGTVVGLQLSDSLRAKLATAGVGVFIGSMVYVILLAVAATFVLPTGTISVAVVFVELTIGAGTLNYGVLLLDAVVVGATGGLAASATTYFVDRYFR